MKRREQGATLLVSLVMLVVLTLLVVSTITSSNTNLRIAGNMQKQNEVGAAAQQAIEQAISSDFTADPAAVAAAPIDVDINKDGTNDYRATVSATCLNSKPVKTEELDPTVAADKFCYQSGAAANTGIIGGSSTGGTSVCKNTQWDVESDVTEPGSGATVTVHQGVAVRVGVNVEC